VFLYLLTVDDPQERQTKENIAAAEDKIAAAQAKAQGEKPQEASAEPQGEKEEAAVPEEGSAAAAVEAE
jgi:hypothetical protein